MSADYALTANFEPVGGGGTGGTGGSGGTEGTGGTGGTGGIGGGPGQVSSLRLLTPNGGESLLSGSTCSVQWQAEGAAGNVRIELSVDGAATWTPVASSATGGHYAWLVPSVDSDRCIIRIVATNGAGMDASNAPFSIHTHAGRMWYVDAAAKGSGDGVTWANALVCLQDAIVKAAPGDSIWVAEGLYWPDLGRGWTAGDRAATFQLKNGVAIYGGFPRGGDWSQRNPLRHQSILSGDIGAIGAAEDNSFHVVSVRGTDQTGVLDGGVITGGCASGSEESQDRGAGLYCFEGYAQVRNCILVGNTAAAQGGGACIVASRVTFINCVFNGNSANDGGALYNDQGTAALINCTVVANQGFWRAGLACPTSVINSILWGNPGRLNRTSYDDLAQISGTLRPAVNFCCVEGWQDSLGGKGNFGRNPLFADAAGPDHILGTPDDDLRLQAGSPCIDQGDNTALGVEIKTDLAGQPRIVNGVIDIGAQESGGPAVGP
jgi:hypothetical protein